MKFFINEVEVKEEEFIDRFLNMRILEEEEHDLSLLYIRAFLESYYTDDVKKAEFARTVGGYEVRRCFRNTHFHTILGQLFEIREETVAPEATPVSE